MEKKNSKPLEWLNKEIEKDDIWILKEKENFINEIKKHKKDEILPEKPKKLTIWQKIKKVLIS